MGKTIMLTASVFVFSAASSGSSIDKNLGNFEDVDLAQSEASQTRQAEECRNRITHAREASGQTPLLEREPASPERPYAIYAVHREQDGCSVMVMMGDSDDIRPLPSAAPDGAQHLPATPDRSRRERDQQLGY